MIKKAKVVIAALSVAVLVGVSSPVSASHFDEMGLSADRAMALIEKDIVTGYPDGSLGLGNGITRAEFSTVAARTIRLFEEDGSKIQIENYFSDVENNAWYSDSLSLSIKKGIINGYPDGTFRPTKGVSNQEVVTMAVRLATTQEERLAIDNQGGYPLNYINAAKDLGLLDNSRVSNFGANATRGDSFNIVYNAMSSIEKNLEDKDEPVAVKESAIEASVLKLVDNKAVVKVLKDDSGKFEKELLLSLKDVKQGRVYKIELTEELEVKSVKEVSEVITGEVSPVGFNTESNNEVQVDKKRFKFSEDTLILENNRVTGKDPAVVTESFQGQLIVHGKDIISINSFKVEGVQEGIVVADGNKLNIKTKGQETIETQDKKFNVIMIKDTGAENGVLSDLREDDFVCISQHGATTDVVAVRESRETPLEIKGGIHKIGDTDGFAFNLTASSYGPLGKEFSVEQVGPSGDAQGVENEINGFFDNFISAEKHRKGVLALLIDADKKIKKASVNINEDSIAIYDIKGNVRAIRIK